jgi:hypothetical protein
MHGHTKVKNYGYCLESCNAKLGGFFYKNILRSVTIIFPHIICKLRLNIFMITALYFYDAFVFYGKLYCLYKTFYTYHLSYQMELLSNKLKQKKRTFRIV